MIWLIVLFVSSHGAAFEKVPMQSMESCLAAADQVQKMEGIVSTVKTECIHD